MARRTPRCAGTRAGPTRGVEPRRRPRPGGVGDRGHRVAGASPGDPTVTMGERHGHGLKVPQYGAQGPKEVDPDDEVEAAEVEADARDGERVSTDHHGHVARDALAGETVTVSNGNPQLLTASSSKAQTSHGSPLEVCVRGALIQ